MTIMGQLEENLGTRQLAGISTAVFCGLHLIVISSIFAYPRIYEITSTNAKIGSKYTVFFIFCQNAKYLPHVYLL